MSHPSKERLKQIKTITIEEKTLDLPLCVTIAINDLFVEINALETDNKNLKTALTEFDNDNNWLIEDQCIDRPVKSGRSDWIYIGKWDPRIFATYAIKGDFLKNTELNERKSLSPYYDPNDEVTELFRDRDRLKERVTKLREALETIKKDPDQMEYGFRATEIANNALAVDSEMEKDKK